MIKETKNPLTRRRELVGTVVSNKMQKTIVVKVDRQVKDPFYKKYVKNSTRYKAHDEKNTAQIGDRVNLVESRPLSKEKRWALKEILKKANVFEAVLDTPSALGMKKAPTKTKRGAK